MYNPDVEEFKGSKSATAFERIKSDEEETKAEASKELSELREGPSAPANSKPKEQP